MLDEISSTINTNEKNVHRIFATWMHTTVLVINNGNKKSESAKKSNYKQKSQTRQTTTMMNSNRTLHIIRFAYLSSEQYQYSTSGVPELIFSTVVCYT